MKTSAKYKYLIAFALPALAFYVAFVVYPLLSTLALSLFTKDMFTGVANYVLLFTNPELSARFWGALVHNAEFFAIAAGTQLPVGLLMAALLTSGAVRRMTGFYRTILFIPTTLSVVIVGFIWRIIISPLWGIVGFPLLGNQFTALPTLSLMSAWQYVGIPMIFLYSALLAIPNDVVEAARIDGASGNRIFWRVKLPLIAPQFGLITILTFIWTFNAFDMIYAVMGADAGPNYSSDIFGTLFYRTFFGWAEQPGDPNLGAATATAIFFIILIVTAGYFFVLQRRLKVHEL